MKKKRLITVLGILLLASSFALCSCTGKDLKNEVRVLIVPKFEIGDMSGDEPGEAQPMAST